MFRAGPALDLDCLVTLRAGEPAFDQPQGRIVLLAAEVVKLRGQGDSFACLFHDERNLACRIYGQRPVECRVLSCRDPEPLARMYDKDRLARSDLMPAGHPLLALIDEHDRRSSPRRLIALLRQLVGGPVEAALAELADLLGYDEAVRRLAGERAGLGPAALDFVFGRPLQAIAAQCGARIATHGERLALVFERGSQALELLPEVDHNEG